MDQKLEPDNAGVGIELGYCIVIDDSYLRYAERMERKQWLNLLEL